MNRIKKRSFKMILLLVLLVGVMITSQMMQAMATSTQPVAVVSTFNQFYTAMYNAKDGDVIGINGTITIAGDQTIGYADKHITFRRMNSSSYFNISSETTFENVTFDGDMKSTSSSFVFANGNVTFKNAIFKNNMNDKGAGGAVHVFNKIANFNNCIFENNVAGGEGGHIFVNNSSTVNIDNSTFKNGHSTMGGGAIINSYHEATTNITNSVITENSTERHGGGIYNMGTMKITGTKIYNNTASNGADIANANANAAYGNLNLADSIETLVELFKDDGIIPKAWVNDYDGSTDLSGAYIDPTAPNSLFKLDYEIPPTEVILSPSSLGTASDGKIIGLESGKHYKITSNDVVSYSKADGSLTVTESEASPLVGTEIIGLTNGETYLVEEFTPAPTTVLLDSASLGIADNEKIIGLSAGKIYKVSVDETINYTKADGTLTSNETEATALEGTEIVGLINGVTYLVEEYTPPVEEPTDPKDPDPEIPDEEDPGEEPKDPVDQEDPDDEDPTDPGTDEDPIQGSNTTTTTNSNNTSNTTNNTTNNSTAHNSDSRDDSSTVNNKDESSTVNNYSYDYSNNTKTESSVLPSNDDIREKGGQASASQHQTITVDYGSIADGIKVQEDGKNITINVNVNVDTKEKEEAEPQAVEVSSSNVEAVQPSSAASNITWVELVKICLLFGIFICVFRRPIAK